MFFICALEAGKNMITIVAIDTLFHDLTRRAIELTIQALPMPCKVLTFSDKPIITGETRVTIQPITCTADYSDICIKNLWMHIDTDFFLIVQYDGFAANSTAWDDNFLSADYIGAPWLPTRKTKSFTVGNGGFSLRSKKLLQALRDPVIQLHPNILDGSNEDFVICHLYKNYLEEAHDIVFAPPSLAQNFSFEYGARPQLTFGMHGIWNVPLYCSKEDTEFFLFSVTIQSWTKLKVIITIHNCLAREWQDLASKLYHQILELRKDIVLH